MLIALAYVLSTVVLIFGAGLTVLGAAATGVIIVAISIALVLGIASLFAWLLGL